jgi:hypothetical protein
MHIGAAIRALGIITLMVGDKTSLINDGFSKTAHRLVTDTLSKYY